MAKYKLNIKEFILIQIKYMLKVIKYNIKTLNNFISVSCHGKL